MRRGKKSCTALLISQKLYNIGKPVPAVDVLIASVCLNRALPVVSKDKHFLAIKEVVKELQVEFLA